MRTVRFLLVFLVLTVLALPGPGNIALARNGEDGISEHLLHGPKFLAVLLGPTETPPVDTIAHGVSVITLSEDETMLGYLVVVHHIQNVTAAHIHCGAPGVPGPIVVPLFPVGAYSVEPTNSDTFLVAGIATEANITPVPDSPACPGGIASFADLVQKMRAGETYVNVHTVQHPTGEIRGQNFMIPLDHNTSP